MIEDNLNIDLNDLIKKQTNIQKIKQILIINYIVYIGEKNYE